MSTPPRPLKRYILPLRVAEAEPTRGGGARDGASCVEIVAGFK